MLKAGDEKDGKTEDKKKEEEEDDEGEKKTLGPFEGTHLHYF